MLVQNGMKSRYNDKFIEMIEGGRTQVDRQLQFTRSLSEHKDWKLAGLLIRVETDRIRPSSKIRVRIQQKKNPGPDLTLKKNMDADPTNKTGPDRTFLLFSIVIFFFIQTIADILTFYTFSQYILIKSLINKEIRWLLGLDPVRNPC